jgi:WD40 repeat protein
VLFHDSRNCALFDNLIDYFNLYEDNFYLIIQKVWAGSSNGLITAYNMTVTTIAAKAALTGHSTWVVKITRINQNQVATGSADKTIRIWNINTSTLVNTYNAHTNEIRSLVVMPTGMLASGSLDGTVCMWDMQNNIMSTVNVANPVISMLWHPISGYLVVNMYYAIGLINISTLALTTIPTGMYVYNDAEVLLPSENLIMVGSMLTIYSLPSGNPILTQVLLSTAYKVKLLPDNITAVVGFYVSGCLQLFNTNSNFMNVQVYQGHASSCTVVAIEVTPDLAYVISSANDQTFVMWRWSTMSLTQANKYTISADMNTAAIIASVYTGGKYIMRYLISNHWANRKSKQKKFLFGLSTENLTS